MTKSTVCVDEIQGSIDIGSFAVINSEAEGSRPSVGIVLPNKCYHSSHRSTSLLV